MGPSTVIFLFTDIQGSTVRWERNRTAMAGAVRRHDEIVTGAVVNARGRVFKTGGDSICAAFATVPDAIEAATQAQLALAREDWSAVGGLEVRMAIHAGAVEARDGDFFGAPLNRVSRLLGIGHGGQVLLSSAAADLAQGETGDGIRIAYIGKHRLRDFEGTERVYQVSAPGLRAQFPALRSIEGTPHNLTAQLTSFVGRARDLERLRERIAGARLLTLVGTGGVGKSRLAQQLARELLEVYADGVWFVDLSRVRDQDAVVSEVAATLNVQAVAHQTVAAAISEAIADKKMLLVLDGCEHVLRAAAFFAEAVLQTCPDTTIVVTSRQAFDVDGETVYNLDSLGEEAAVALFVDRAAAASSKFSAEGQADALRDICRRLDGIPLALELAAAKTAVLGLKQLREKLNERFRLLTHGGANRLPRQQTLRALIDWSYDLLDEDERTVFGRAGVFAGGCTLEAAAAVCGDERIDDWRVFEVLSNLVAKSLVIAEQIGDGQRYRMLNSIRDYALERLLAQSAVEIVSHYARGYYARLLRDARTLIDDLEDERWQERLAPDVNNLRFTFDVSSGKDVAIALQALSDVEWPHLLTTPQEALSWFEEALPHLNACDDPLVRARIRRQCVRLEWLAGRPVAEIERTALAALEAARESGDPSEIAYSLSNLATNYRDMGRFDDAEALYAQAFASPDALSPVARNAVLRNWAITNLQAGDLENARRRFAEVARAERPGSASNAGALLNLGELEFAMGNVDAARAAATQACEIYRRIDETTLALAYCNLGAYAMHCDDLQDATQMLRDALQFARQRGSFTTMALEHHALLGGLTGQYARAALLLGFTEASYAARGKVRQHTESRGYARLQTLLASVFDEGQRERHAREGAQLRMEQAIELAAAISSATQSTAAERGA